MPLVICQVCQTPFHVKPSRLQRGNVSCCSIVCYSISRQHRVPVVCATCGITFAVWPTRAQQSLNHFCSHACRGQFRVTSETRLCLICDKPFSVTQSALAKGAGKYCSVGCQAIGRRKPLAERFWAKVQIIDDFFSCWPWMGATNSDGYGEIGIEGKSVKAHRVAFVIAHDLTLADINGSEIMHTCDNPPCMRDIHLVEGTHADNMRDMGEKERMKRGTKATSEMVRMIRRLRPSTPLKEIAEQLHISEASVSLIARSIHRKYVR